MDAKFMFLALFPLTILFGYEKTLKSGDITFHISSHKKGDERMLTITPHGFSQDNRPETISIEGTIVDTVVSDLNSDGAPELYIFLSSEGSGAYGSMVAYASNRNKSMSMVYFPELSPNTKEAQGYMGHDRFRIEQSFLIREYPIYKKEDPNCCPSGGIRRLRYRLVPAEATWKLKLIDYETIVPKK